MRDAIDLETDELLPVNRICKTRIGKRMSPATLWRWRLKGVNGARLECVRVGASWCTTHEAFSRFLRAQQQCEPLNRESADHSESTRRHLEDAGLL